MNAKDRYLVDLDARLERLPLPVAAPATKPRCGDHLTETSWDEGYFCSLPYDHAGPHRDETDGRAVNESTAETGRRYSWAYEWTYKDENVT